jgi:hypothetical protein
VEKGQMNAQTHAQRTDGQTAVGHSQDRLTHDPWDPGTAGTQGRRALDWGS